MATSGGSLDSYDPVTKTCVTSKGKWYLGTSEVASCPTGIKPYESTKTSNCGYDIPTGWTDTFAATNFSMKNKKLAKSTSLDYKRSFVLSSFDASAGTCSCSWATTISPADVATFKCKILCEDK